MDIALASGLGMHTVSDWHHRYILDSVLLYALLDIVSKYFFWALGAGLNVIKIPKTGSNV